MEKILTVNNLHVEVDGREILKGVNLKINPGEIHAIMGENGSGKSSLALSIAGHPRYKITQGEILFNGKNLREMSVDERSKSGLFLSMQNPQEIEGLRFARFLSEIRKTSSKDFNIIDFQNEIKKKIFEFGLEEQVLNRSVNLGLSGGEKKKSEMLQLSLLNPKLAIFDEIDSGLDIDTMKKISNDINKFKDNEKSLLLITHYKRLLEYVNPDFVHVMIDGKIVKSGAKELADEIEKGGYHLLKNASS